MTSTKTAQSGRPAARETEKLEVRYGDIGISAVAAATRYCGSERSPSTGAKEDKKANERELA